MVSWIKKLLTKSVDPTFDDKRDAFVQAQEESDEPWAMYEVRGIDESGQAEVHFAWNPAFIKMVHKHGVHAETEEDTVQLFFYASALRPQGYDLAQDEPIQPSGHVNLNPNTRLVR